MPESIEPKSIALRVRSLREQQGWSLTELSTRSGISRSYLHQIEQGDSTPTLDKVQQLATAFGILPSTLLGEKENQEINAYVPKSLRDFADKAGLLDADVDMLAKIQYRGRRPNTVEEWKALYSVIKGLLEDTT